MVQELSAKVDQVEQLRKQLLLELLQKNQEIQTESTEQIYVHVVQKLNQPAKEHQKINWSFITSITGLMNFVLLIYIIFIR